MKPRLSLYLVFALALTCTQPAPAQSARPSGNNNAMLQQLAAERTQLQTENARLKADLGAAKMELEDLKKKQGEIERRAQGGGAVAARSNARADSLQAELDREKGRQAELVAKFREIAGMLREVETDRTAVRTQLGQRDAELRQCVDRNRALYDMNGEILTRLEKRGSFTPASALEPFTRLKRVELENLIDGYQSRAEEQRVPAAAVPAPPPPPG